MLQIQKSAHFGICDCRPSYCTLHQWLLHQHSHTPYQGLLVDSSCSMPCPCTTKLVENGWKIRWPQMGEDPHQFRSTTRFQMLCRFHWDIIRQPQKNHRLGFRRTPQSFKNQARVPNSLEAITKRMDQPPPPNCKLQQPTELSILQENPQIDTF